MGKPDEELYSAEYMVRAKCKKNTIFFWKRKVGIQLILHTQALEVAKDENWYPFEETRDLNGINSPILYIVGEGMKAEVKGALLYHSMKDDIHVSIIPFASHLVHSEQPGIYTEILEGFIHEVNKGY